MLKAIELESGSYQLSLDAGLDKEGNDRRVAKNGKEQHILDRILEAQSLVNALSVFARQGYKISSSYAVIRKGEIHHYYLLGNYGKPGNSDARAAKMRRKNQNGAKLSPEEKKQREIKLNEARDK